MPATNVVSERSFSALKPFGTYLRSTTGQARLNHLMRLQHVHKEFADGIDVVAVANLWETTTGAGFFSRRFLNTTFL